MPLPSFDECLKIMDQVDKCARVLQRTDDLAHELATPAGAERVIDMDPDDPADDGEDTREDDDSDKGESL